MKKARMVGESSSLGGRGMKMMNITPQPNSKAEYSAKNNHAKLALPYSVLYPETNSDSDSLKSKGARWVSARREKDQRGAITIRVKREKEDPIDIILYDLARTQDKITNVVNTASQDTDCAIDRNLPIKVYLEFDLHPEINANRTNMDPNTRYISIEYLIEKDR